MIYPTQAYLFNLCIHVQYTHPLDHPHSSSALFRLVPQSSSPHQDCWES